MEEPQEGLRPSTERTLQSHPKPFHRLDAGTWLHDRPEEDVFIPLIDSFRLRLDDDYKFDGDVEVGTVYDGAPNSAPAFRRFLKRAEKRTGLLPSWWTKEKSTACVAFGLRHQSWSSLSGAPEKGDFIEHYGDRLMPMQLRMLREVIDKRGPGGQDGTSMRKMMMAKEAGGGISTILDTSSMFQRFGI